MFTLAGHTDRVNGVAFSPDGRYLASSSWDDDIRLWDATTGAERRRLKGHTGSVWAISFSPDGGRIASASWDHKVKVWSVEDGRELLTFSEHTAPVHSVAFSPDGQRLVSGGFDGQVKVWEADDGSNDRQLRRIRLPHPGRGVQPGRTPCRFRRGRSRGQGLGRRHRGACSSR